MTDVLLRGEPWPKKAPDGWESVRRRLGNELADLYEALRRVLAERGDSSSWDEQLLCREMSLQLREIVRDRGRPNATVSIRPWRLQTLLRQLEDVGLIALDEE